MLKKNVAGIEKMMADYLQYRWRLYLHVRAGCGRDEARPDFCHYSGACDLIQAIGGKWVRDYKGGNTQEEADNPKNYSHWVMLPTDACCSRMNFDAWKE